MRNRMNKQKTNNKMTLTSPNIAIIILSVNGLIHQPKQRLAEQIGKT